MHRLVPGVVVVGLLIAGCSSTSDKASMTPSTPAPERLAEPLTFYSALEADQDHEEKYWSVMRDQLGIGLSEDVRTDAYGSWHPLTVSPDAPLLDIDPGALPDDLDPSWSPERLRETWQAMAEFLVNERLDSELVWDDTPANRQTVGNRVDSGVFAWDFYSEAFPFVNYLVGETWRIGFSRYGSVAVDQNYGGWRQAGGASDDVRRIPVKPAPYSLEEPRTLVRMIEVAGIEQDEVPNAISIEALVQYDRPVRAEGIEARRYEQGFVRVTLRMAYTERPVMTDIMHVGMNSFRDYAVVSNETRRRLPLLDSTSVDGWVGHEVLGLALSLPASATPDSDGTCEDQLSEDRAGQTFRLEMGVEGRVGCAWVSRWSPEADGEPTTEVVWPNETIWGAEAPGVLGTVDVRVFSTYDTVDFYLTEGPGPCYQITADVPSGTGEQFARQVLSTLDASAVASPTPSGT